jgi:DNA-binding Lrp family transcriptional regulator
MWFVVATGSPEELPAVLREIEAGTGIEVYSFPKEREFYLGLWLELGEQGQVDTVPCPARRLEPPAPLDTLDRAIITATQNGLPLQDDPYIQIAQQLDISGGVLLERLRGMLATGVIRRIGAVPNHYRLGLRGNGMTVWDIPDEQVDALGERLGALDFVSHCYRRPRHPGIWRYNLFAMVHGTDRLEVLAKTEQMTALLDGHFRAYDVLFSGAVLKKTGLRLAA